MAWVTYTIEISLLTVLEAGKWKIKAQVDFVSCENSLPDLLPSGCVLTFFSYKTTDSIVRASPSWPKLTLITSQRPHFQIPSHWGFGILAEHKHSVHNNSIPDLGPPNRREITADKLLDYLTQLPYSYQREVICFALAAKYSFHLLVTNIRFQSNLTYVSSLWWLDWFILYS